MPVPLDLHVDPADELPIYRQIVRQIAAAIASGRLAAGEKLASHRELAERLVVAPLTVKKAYGELERGGHVETRRGLGSFVAEDPPRAPRPELLERLREGARRLAGDAWLAGVDPAGLRRLVDEEVARLDGERRSHEGGDR